MTTFGQEVFSVIIVHYQQPQYWRQAVDSVCMQTYPYIQIIFADDGSEGFYLPEVEAYIGGQSRKGIEYQVITNAQNVGTVCNLNHAVSMVSGGYMTLLAADDAFCDVNVLSSYARELSRMMDTDAAGIYGRSFLCDGCLRRTGREYLEPEEAFACNELDWKGQFAKLAEKCFFPIGASAFYTKELLRFFPLDTHYKLIEDWPLFLKMNRAHRRMLFCDFPVLLHRAGGVSDAACPVRGHRIQCDCDHLLFHEREIWPYVRRLSREDLKKFVFRYCRDREQMKEAAARMKLKPEWRLAFYDLRSRSFFKEYAQETAVKA